MGFLADASGRLLRTDWRNPSELADELFAMFQGSDPIQITSPVQATNPGTGPAFSLNLGNGDGIRISRGGWTTTLGMDDKGHLTIADPVPTSSPLGLGSTSTNGSIGGGGTRRRLGEGGGLMGLVVSGPATPGAAGQSGQQTYQVALYENGFGEPSTQTITATQVLIDLGETIPPGWAVTLYTDQNGDYWMQVPTWMP